ncbi:MAG: hypothetical protein LBR21_04685 [Propionibacteriaceae bacterium]|jgi:hypothetical protein|nr:hypothetical protein [Propionibacteriaceae bacterium]
MDDFLVMEEAGEENTATEAAVLASGSAEPEDGASVPGTRVAEEPKAGNTRLGRKWWIAGVAGVLALGVGLGVWAFGPGHSPKPEPCAALDSLVTHLKESGWSKSDMRSLPVTSLPVEGSCTGILSDGQGQAVGDGDQVFLDFSLYLTDDGTRENAQDNYKYKVDTKDPKQSGFSTALVGVKRGSQVLVAYRDGRDRPHVAYLSRVE